MKRALMAAILVILPFTILEFGLRLAGIGGSVVYKEDPICGYRPIPNQRFSTMGRPVSILENGFRGPPATNDLLFIGDSVTYGTAYLRDADTFPALLGGSNAGVNGWGVQNMARFLAHFDVHPYRAVVWVIPSCDVLRPYTTLRKGLISTNRRMWFRCEYLVRFFWYGLLRPQPVAVDPNSYEPNWEAVSKTCAQLKAEGVPTLLVFLPYRDEVLGTTMTETPYFHRMMDDAVQAGIPFVYAQPTGDVHLIYRDVGHLTEAGCRWLAGVIADALKKEGL